MFGRNNKMMKQLDLIYDLFETQKKINQKQSDMNDLIFKASKLLSEKLDFHRKELTILNNDINDLNDVVQSLIAYKVSDCQKDVSTKDVN